MGQFPYSIVEKISFKRCAGTAEEKQAAALIREEIKNLGGQAWDMPFMIPDTRIKQCSVRVKEPFEKEIEAVPYGRSGSLPAGGAELALFYAERGIEEDFTGREDLSDTAVLLNSLSPEVYELLCKKHAAAFLVIKGKYYEDLQQSNSYMRNLRPNYLKNGYVPGFMIGAADAMALVEQQVKTVELTLEQEDSNAESQNVLAVIPGTECPGESIVLTAHYDSVPVGKGAWDNATGTAALLYLYRHFLAHPARRTLRFIWCGAEEVGLLGSKAYVEQQKEAMEEIQFCFNFDMCGTILGPNEIYVTGKEELKTYADQFARMEGYPAKVLSLVHHSDSAPFADREIPAVGISRGTETANIHTHMDLIDIISPEQLEKNAAFAVRMVSHVANAICLPVGKGMEEDIRKELDEYFDKQKAEA